MSLPCSDRTIKSLHSSSLKNKMYKHSLACSDQESLALPGMHTRQQSLGAERHGCLACSAAVGQICLVSKSGQEVLGMQKILRLQKVDEPLRHDDKCQGKSKRGKEINQEALSKSHHGTTLDMPSQQCS